MVKYIVVNCHEAVEKGLPVLYPPEKDENYNILYCVDNGIYTELFSDNMEPEDATLLRSLSSLVAELNYLATLL